MDRSSITNPLEFFKPPVTIYDVPRTMKAAPIKETAYKETITKNQKEKQEKNEKMKSMSESNVMMAKSGLKTTNSVTESNIFSQQNPKNEFLTRQTVGPNQIYQKQLQQHNNQLVPPANIPYQNRLNHSVNNFLATKNVPYQNRLPPSVNNFVNMAFRNYAHQNYYQPSIQPFIPANMPFSFPLQPNIQVNSFPSTINSNPNVYFPMMPPMHMNPLDDFLADLGHFKILNVQ